MTDEQDADAAALQIAHDGEQMFRLVRSQGGRRLVHHDDPRVARQRLGDLNKLLPGRRQFAARNVEIDFDAETLKQLGRPSLFATSVNQPCPRCFLTEKNVLIRRQAWHQIELLINHRDPGGARLLRRLKGRLAAVDRNRSRISPMGSAQDANQRAFAGPVLAEQREHFAGMQCQVDAA